MIEEKPDCVVCTEDLEKDAIVTIEHGKIIKLETDHWGSKRIETEPYDYLVTENIKKGSNIVRCFKSWYEPWSQWYHENEKSGTIFSYNKKEDEKPLQNAIMGVEYYSKYGYTRQDLYKGQKIECQNTVYTVLHFIPVNVQVYLYTDKKEAVVYMYPHWQYPREKAMEYAKANQQTELIHKELTTIYQEIKNCRRQLENAEIKHAQKLVELQQVCVHPSTEWVEIIRFSTIQQCKLCGLYKRQNQTEWQVKPYKSWEYPKY
jgi:hypothetical protein